MCAPAAEQGGRQGCALGPAVRRDENSSIARDQTGAMTDLQILCSESGKAAHHHRIMNYHVTAPEGRGRSATSSQNFTDELQLTAEFDATRGEDSYSPPVLTSEQDSISVIAWKGNQSNHCVYRLLFVFTLWNYCFAAAWPARSSSMIRNMKIIYLMCTTAPPALPVLTWMSWLNSCVSWTCILNGFVQMGTTV